jgi:hypothetical protein
MFTCRRRSLSSSAATWSGSSRKARLRCRRSPGNFGMSASSLLRWLKLSNLYYGSRLGVTGTESTELRELRKRSRTLSGTGGWVRCRHGHGLTACHRNGAAARRGWPRRCARQEGRARVRGDRRDADRHRPGRQRPADLLRLAPPPRDEPAGHLQPGQRHPLGLGAAARQRARHDRRPDWGIVRELAAAGLTRWPTKATSALASVS